MKWMVIAVSFLLLWSSQAAFAVAAAPGAAGV